MPIHDASDPINTKNRCSWWGAGLRSARQDAPNHQKFSANSYARTHLTIGVDAYIDPAECTISTEIFGEFVTSQRADVGIGPYKRGGMCIWIRRRYSQNSCVPCWPTPSSAPSERSPTARPGSGSRRTASAAAPHPHSAPAAPRPRRRRCPQAPRARLPARQSACS